MPARLVSSYLPPALRVGYLLQRRGVDAGAQPGGPGPVLEDVAQVAAALRAGDLGPDHPVGGVRLRVHPAVGDGLGEAGPAGARVELRLRAEQRRPTPRA